MAEDLTGQKHHMLTFLHKDENNKRKWVCLCDCGNKTSIYPYSVKKGATKSCGCLHSKIMSERLTKDLTGRRFGRLVVLHRDDNKPKSHGAYWVCRCDCGNIVSVISQSLTSGNTKSCGCLKSELTSNGFSLDICGKKFGKLTVLERCGTFVGEDGGQYSQWLCECECGTKKVIRGHDLVRGCVTSCGCTISSGEEEIRKFLNNANVNFDTQYGFKDLESSKGWMLKFDFAIFNEINELLALIEYQGQQHYDENNWYFGEQQRNETDALKKKYCEMKNIPLFEISYEDDIELSLEDILELLNINTHMPITCQAS